MYIIAKQHNAGTGRAKKKAAAKQARKEKREAAKRAKWNEERKEQRRRRRRRERLGVVPVNSSYITMPSGPAPPPLPTASTSAASHVPHPLPSRPHLAHPLRLPASTSVPLPSFERPLQAQYPGGLSIREWVDPAGMFVRRKVTAEGVVLVQREGRVPADSLLAAAMFRGEYGGVPESARSLQRGLASGIPYQVDAPQVLLGGLPMSTIGHDAGIDHGLPYPANSVYPVSSQVDVSAGTYTRPWNDYPVGRGNDGYDDQDEYESGWDQDEEDDGYQGPYDEQFYEDMERNLTFAEWQYGPYWDSD